MKRSIAAAWSLVAFCIVTGCGANTETVPVVPEPYIVVWNPEPGMVYDKRQDLRQRLRICLSL